MSIHLMINACLFAFAHQTNSRSRFLIMFKLFVLLITLGVICADDDVWWHHASVYQIYPRSFKDSNGDGTGDLKGMQFLTF